MTLDPGSLVFAYGKLGSVRSSTTWHGLPAYTLDLGDGQQMLAYAATCEPVVCRGGPAVSLGYHRRIRDAFRPRPTPPRPPRRPHRWPAA